MRSISIRFNRLFAAVWLLGHALCGTAHADASIPAANAALCGDLDGVAAAGRTIAVWAGTAVAVSRDDGASFARVAGRSGRVSSVAVGDDGTLYVARDRSLEVVASGGRVVNRALPFAGRLAAGSGRLALATVVDGERQDRVAVALSRDGGASWRPLRSPHAASSWPTCCSENAYRGIGSISIAVGERAIEVSGADYDCWAGNAWIYRWDGRWKEILSPSEQLEPKPTVVLDGADRPLITDDRTLRRGGRSLFVAPVCRSPG
jgi:hypothetical protein